MRNFLFLIEIWANLVSGFEFKMKMGLFVYLFISRSSFDSASDPVDWIDEFQQEVFEVIGFLSQNTSISGLFKKEEAFRMRMMHRSDKIITYFKSPCADRLYQATPMTVDALFVVDCDAMSQRAGICAASMVEEGYKVVEVINNNYLIPCHPNLHFDQIAKKMFRGLMEVLCRLSVKGTVQGYKCMYQSLTVSDLKGIEIIF